METRITNATRMSWTRRAAVPLACGLALSALVPLRAKAEPEPAHCRALRAEASSSAAVLELPRVEAQGIRSPGAGDIDGTGSIPLEGMQARALVGWSAVGLMRGQSLRAGAAAECEKWRAAEEIEQVLRQGTSFGRVEALRAQIAALEAGLPRVRELVEEARVRLERSIITVLELDAIELRRLSLETTLGELRHELAMLETQERVEDASGLGDALARYERAAGEVEREQARRRRLNAWKLDVSAGAIPAPRQDWFGNVSVGWNFGGLSQTAEEARAKAAHEEARRSDTNELRPRAERFAASMQESARKLGEELVLIDRQIELHARRLADRPESDRLRQALASLEVGEIELRARRTFVERLRLARDAVGSLAP